MPKLITEILRDVFIHLLDSNFQDAKYAEKFMLSGKESYEAAIKFFATAKKVTLIRDDFVVFFPSGHHMLMAYDCVLLKPILKAIAKSVESVEFRKRPVGAGENIVYEALIKEGLKSVYFCGGHDLPEIYMDRIKSLVSLESANFDDKILNISDLAVIRPPCSEAFIKVNFANLISQKLDNVHFPQLETLDIIGDFDCSVDNPQSIKQVIATIFKIFPSLKTLKASFGNFIKHKINIFGYDRLEPSLKLILETMELVNAEMFACIPKHVKGIFTFQCLTDKKDVENINEIYADREGFRVTEKYVEKHFSIHENMEFSFYAIFDYFDGVEEDDHSASDEDADSDSDDVEMEADEENEKVVVMDH